MSEFNREERYVVLKRSEIEKHLGEFGKAELAYWIERVGTVRGLVVEADWPEYEPTWAAIEARMTAEPPKGGGQ